MHKASNEPSPDSAESVHPLRLAAMAAPVILGLALLNTPAVSAGEGARPSDERLQDQVRMLTGEDGGNTGYAATRAQKHRDTASGVAPVDQDQSARPRNLRFGVGYESRMGIGLSASPGGTGRQGAGSGGR